MTSYGIDPITDKERRFAADVARLGAERGLTPGQVLVAFGAVAAAAVQYEVRCGRAQRATAMDTAIGIFTDSLLGSLDEEYYKGPSL